MPYESTANKDAIRQIWDRSLLETWTSALGRPLSYFGLTGPQIRDLMEWKDLLARARTAVESPGHTRRERELAAETIGLLHTNVLEHGLSSGFQLLIADVEDVLIEGVDQHGTPPQLNDGGPAHRSHFTYDVVNLDFDGGLGYRDQRGVVKRLSALRKLFERQEGTDFIFLLTVNVRDTLGDAIEQDLRGLQTRDRGSEWRNILDWYLARGDGERDFKLKAVVTSFVKYVSEPRGFTCYSRPPITYVGHQNAHMVHFSFELHWQAGLIRGWGTQDDRHVLDLPMLQSVDGALTFSRLQHPGLKLSSCEDLFNFLPDTMRSILLDSFIQIANYE